MKTNSNNLSWSTGLPAVAAVVILLSGCVATRNWVREQVDPLSGRVSENETRIGQAEGKIGQIGDRMTAAEGKLTNVEGKLTSVEGKLGDVDSKADRALSTFGNLRFERRLVVDMKDGANFGFNSASLPPQARKEIDGFLSDLKGDLAGGESAVFLVAGHTDNAGPDDFNYELGKRRADAVSRYLVTQKKIDPLRVVAVSYGEIAPVAENKTRDGRAKNRRVEILVYREAVTAAPAAASTSPQEQKQSQATDGKQVTRSY